MRNITSSQASRQMRTNPLTATLYAMRSELKGKYGCTDEEMAQALSLMLEGGEFPDGKNAAEEFASKLRQVKGDIVVPAEKKVSYTADEARSLLLQVA